VRRIVSVRNNSFRVSFLKTELRTLHFVLFL